MQDTGQQFCLCLIGPEWMESPHWGGEKARGSAGYSQLLGLGLFSSTEL